MSLFTELKRRNVLRVLLAYVVFSWLAMQVADVLQSALDLPTLWSKGLLALLAIGVVPVVVFAWVYEMTPEGLKRESEVSREASITAHTARKLDYVVIVLLVVAIGFFAYDRLTRAPAPTATAPAEAPTADQQQVPVVAVLPLKALSTEEEGTFLASGLHDDLARLQGDLAHLGDGVRRQQEEHPPDRPGTGRPLHPGGWPASHRRAGEHQRPVDRRHHRPAPVGRDLQP